jgi:cytochrome c biogenesis protein ResB
MDLAAVMIFVVLVVAILGSCFPQLSSAVAVDPERLAQWEAAVRGRYGGLADALVAVGAFRCFRSTVFLVPLALLVVATLVCTLDRWRGLWRRAFRQPVRCSQAVFDDAPHTARLDALPAVDLVGVVCERLEQRGFRVRTTEVVTTEERFVYLRGDRHRLAVLATLVTHLAVWLLLAGVALSGLVGWREEVTVGPDETVGVGHGSGLALRNAEFTVARYPDGSVADYEALVAVFAGDQQVAHGTIRVGVPLAYGSVGFHLHGYGGTEGRYSVTLLAVRDPGYGLVVAAGFLLLLGMTVSFNFPHACVRARIGPPGTLCLAGQAGRRATGVLTRHGFEREFAGLVEEIGRAAHSAEEDTA